MRSATRTIMKDFARYLAIAAAILLMLTGLMYFVFLALGYDVVPVDRVCDTP